MITVEEIKPEPPTPPQQQSFLSAMITAFFSTTTTTTTTTTTPLSTTPLSTTTTPTHKTIIKFTFQFGCEGNNPELTEAELKTHLEGLPTAIAAHPQFNDFFTIDTTQPQLVTMSELTQTPSTFPSGAVGMGLWGLVALVVAVIAF